MPAVLSQNLGILVITATILVMLGARIRMPSLVVYLFAGLLLGPVTGLVDPHPAFELISESGITLLLFLVGLEISVERIRDIGKVALFAGIGQVIFTAAIGFILAWALGYTNIESIYLAVALTFSSTVVVVKLLDQKGHLDRLYGRIAVGIFLVQDIVAILILTVLSGLQGAENPSVTDIALGILKSFLALGGMVGLMMVASRWLLPKPFHWASRSMDTLTIWSLAWCFGISILAKTLHLSIEIGAFMAGIALAQHSYAEDLRRRVHPIMNFFIMIFFVLLGIRMDFSEAATQLDKALFLALFVLIGNPFIFILIMVKMKYDERTSFFTGVTVAQISEFSFIFAAAGISAGIIGSHVLSVISLVGILTISVSAYMIIYSEQLYSLLQRSGVLKFFRAPAPLDDTPEPPQRHIILIGMNELGRKLVKELTTLNHQNILAIDMDPHKLKNLPCRTMIGNIEYASTLEEAGFARAKVIISTLRSEETNNLLAFHARKAGVPIAVHAADPSMKDGLTAIGADYIISPKESVVSDFQTFLSRKGGGL